MKRLADALEKGLFYVSGFLFLAIFLLNIYQVAIRYFSAKSYAWVPDVSQLLFTWMIFLGGAVAFKRNDHLKMDFLVGNANPKVRTVLNWVMTVLKIVFFVVLVVYGYAVTQIRMRVYYTGVNIPSGYSFMAVPVAGVLMLFFMLTDLLTKRENLLTRREKR